MLVYVEGCGCFSCWLCSFVFSFLIRMRVEVLSCCMFVCASLSVWSSLGRATAPYIGIERDSCVPVYVFCLSSSVEFQVPSGEVFQIFLKIIMKVRQGNLSFYSHICSELRITSATNGVEENCIGASSRMWGLYSQILPVLYCRLPIKPKPNSFLSSIPTLFLSSTPSLF